MENVEIKDKLKISPYSKIKVNWSDKPENYSKEAKNKITAHFAKKYGVPKTNIIVSYHPVKFNDKGDMIEIENASIESVMDLNYQRGLMKEVIKRNEIKVDWDRILALDDKVNAELNIDLTASQHKHWLVKWLMIDNLLSFGPNNYISFGKLRGLTVVNSLPTNMGGKTTLSIDALKFLLYGTTTKTDKNEQIFNLYSGKNEVNVRGMIEIESEEIIIERKMKRSPKKAGGWNVTNVVNYYRLLPDGTEDIQNEDDVKKTSKLLGETIGKEDDFELLALATEKNLDDLIGLTTTESGKVLTRLIGLEILELKEAVVRKMFNEFSAKKTSNNYDVITLGNEIEDHNKKISDGNEIEKTLSDKLAETKKEILRLQNENDRLLNSKKTVDVTVLALNPSKLDAEIKEIKTKGIALSGKVAIIKTDIEKIGVVNFDEDRHHELTKELSTKTTSEAVKKAEVLRLKGVVKSLIAGGICQSCNRKLDNVDNTEHIKTHEKQISILENETLILTTEIAKINVELLMLGETKKQIDAKNRLELDKSRMEVEMDTLRNQLQLKLIDLAKYNSNLEAIEFNRKVDSDVSLVKTNISVQEYAKDDTSSKIQRVQNDIVTNKTSIETKTKLVEKIKKEEEIEKIFKIYIDLVGKKGISKLVLRSVLPIINSEVQRLLEDVCDFEIEIFMDDKNDVQFLIIRDEVSRLLKSGSGYEKTASSLALRSVLGKISTLPMPNFITFDEVLGKVASENIEKLKTLFDKIKDMYEIVFLITHSSQVATWGDSTVTVIKENNISRLTY